MSINFHQLRCFNAVAEHGSFTAAARALFVGQPSVTTHVRALESRFGAELFCRRGHSVQLTEAGQCLLKITQRIFTLEKEAEETLRAAGGLLIGELRVAAFNPIQATRMVAAFNRLYPHVRLVVTLGNTREMVEALLTFKADVATLPQMNDARFRCVAYGAASIMLLVPEAHPWARRKAISLSELAGQRMIMREEGSMHQQVFWDHLAELGVAVDVTLETDSQEAVREAVATGMGLGIALGAESAFDPRLRNIAIADISSFPQLEIACLVERQEAPLIRAFFDAVKLLASSAPAGPAAHGS